MLKSLPPQVQSQVHFQKPKLDLLLTFLSSEQIDLSKIALPEEPIISRDTMAGWLKRNVPRLITPSGSNRNRPDFRLPYNNPMHERSDETKNDCPLHAIQSDIAEILKECKEKSTIVLAGSSGCGKVSFVLYFDVRVVVLTFFPLRLLCL